MIYLSSCCPQRTHSVSVSSSTGICCHHLSVSLFLFCQFGPCTTLKALPNCLPSYADAVARVAAAITEHMDMCTVETTIINIFSFANVRVKINDVLSASRNGVHFPRTVRKKVYRNAIRNMYRNVAATQFAGTRGLQAGTCICNYRHRMVYPPHAHLYELHTSTGNPSFIQNPLLTGLRRPKGAQRLFNLFRLNNPARFP